MKTNKKEERELRASENMKRTIERLEKKWGKLNKDYFIETIESNRIGNGFYDGCELTCDIIKSLYIIVAHDGTYYQK